MDRLIKESFTTDIIGGLFKIVELLPRLLYVLIIRLPKLVITRLVTSKIDRQLSNYAKQSLAYRAKIKENTILFATDQGEYTCNPKYIAEEIRRRDLPYKITWVLRGAALGPYPEGFEFVKYGSPEFYRAVANSKIVIMNGHSLQRAGVHKSKNQFWIQTWHGSLGLKRLEGAGGDVKFYEAMQKADSQKTDYLITNSQFEEHVFSSTYWPNVSALRLGHARNDILFDTSKTTREYLRRKVLKRLGIDDRGQKFLLYAPTHNDKNGDPNNFSLDFDELREVLVKKFGGEWDILIRTHNSNKGNSTKWLAGLPMYCINASFYPDMQELMMVANVGITDYSSWICDYILTKKPSFLYGTNVDTYSQTRGFYHKFEDTPFSLAINNEQLVQNIKDFDQSAYEQKIKDFLKMCECMDDGQASKRIVDKIEELMLE